MKLDVYYKSHNHTYKIYEYESTNELIGWNIIRTYMTFFIRIHSHMFIVNHTWMVLVLCHISLLDLKIEQLIKSGKELVLVIWSM